MSERDYPSIFSRLWGLTAAQRAEVFQLAEQRWCWHCGGPQGECECSVNTEPEPTWLPAVGTVDLKVCSRCLTYALEGEGACSTCGARPDDDATWREQSTAAAFRATPCVPLETEEGR